MTNLTAYQEQRKRQREEEQMLAKCAEARNEEQRLEKALRAWTKGKLGEVDLGLTSEMFPLLAHNWYLVPLHYGKGDEVFLARARRVKEMMDQYNQLQRLIWQRKDRLLGLALRQVDGRYGARWVHPKLP